MITLSFFDFLKKTVSLQFNNQTVKYIDLVVSKTLLGFLTRTSNSIYIGPIIL